MFSKSRIKPSCFPPTNEMCLVDKNKNQVCIKYLDAVINDGILCLRTEHLDIKLALRECVCVCGGEGGGERNRKIVLFK